MPRHEHWAPEAATRATSTEFHGGAGGTAGLKSCQKEQIGIWNKELNNILTPDQPPPAAYYVISHCSVGSYGKLEH